MFYSHHWFDTSQCQRNISYTVYLLIWQVLQVAITVVVEAAAGFTTNQLILLRHQQRSSNLINQLLLRTVTENITYCDDQDACCHKMWESPDPRMVSVKVIYTFWERVCFVFMIWVSFLADIVLILSSSFYIWKNYLLFLLLA